MFGLQIRERVGVCVLWRGMGVEGLRGGSEREGSESNLVKWLQQPSASLVRIGVAPAGSVCRQTPHDTEDRQHHRLDNSRPLQPSPVFSLSLPFIFLQLLSLPLFTTFAAHNRIANVNYIIYAVLLCLAQSYGDSVDCCVVT